MRLLHISDLHIGKSVCEFSLLEDQRHVLEQVIGMIGGRGVDAVLVAGDLYDRSMPSADAVALVDWFLAQLAATGVPAIVTAGNHDSAERVAYASSLLANQGIHVSPVFDGRIEPVRLTDELGPVDVWPIPFLQPVTVRHFFPDAQVLDYTDALRVVVDACELRDVDEEGRRVRNVCVAHQFVTSGGISPERCASELSLGGMDNVDASVFDPFDYVALGHVHGAQRVGRDAVRYSGSILKYSLSEWRGQKSATLVELGKPGDEPAIELAALEPLHDLRRLRGPLERLVSSEVAGEPGTSREDYIYAVLTDENPVLDALAQLREVYPNVMSLEYDNARTRAAGVSSDAPAAGEDGASPLDLFCEFYELQNGSELTDAQRGVAVDELKKIEEK